MNRTRFAVLLLIAAICLWGCGNIPNRKVTEPAGTTLGQPETTAASDPTHTEPTETTLPEQTVPTEPELSVVKGQVVEITENIPAFDTDSQECMLLLEEHYQDFSVYYAHFPSHFSSAWYPYENGVFRIPEPGEMEAKSGTTHYDLYAIRDGKLHKLQERSFCKEYTLFGERFTLELDYAVDGERVILTYTPAVLPPTAKVVSLDRGAEEVLVRFDCVAGSYYAAINLETGELTDFLEGLGLIDHDLSFYPSQRWCEWREDNSLILSKQSGDWRYVDAVHKEIREYIPEEAEEAPELNFSVSENGTLSVLDIMDGEEVVIQLPQDWVGKKLYWSQSITYRYDKYRTAVCYKVDNTGVFQLLLFDADSNTLYNIRRTNASWMDSECIFSYSSNVMSIWSRDEKNICVYDFKPHVTE